MSDANLILIFQIKNKKRVKKNIVLYVIKSFVYIENLHLRQKIVIIIRVIMSKLKLKYGIKPKWIDDLKNIVRQGEIPSIVNHNLSLSVLHGGNLTPLVLKEDSNKLKFTNQTLDEYIIDDISDCQELRTDVSMMSSDGFFKYVIDDENSIDYDNVKDGKHLKSNLL